MEILTDDDDLNAEAIYAALVYLRDYAESAEGEADFRELMDRRSAKVDFFRSIIDEIPAPPSGEVRVRPIPKFEITPELCEEIYSGEPLSVEVGLGFARWLIWGNPAVAESLAQNDGPPGEAVHRFLADRAH